MKIISLLLASAFCVLMSFSFRSPSAKSNQQDGLVKWYTLEEAQEAMKTDKKKIMIDVYTPWCGPCKMMMRDTFSDPKVAAYINEHYYAVKFNAEGPDQVVWKGKTYSNEQYVPGRQGRNGTHQLTHEIAAVNGRIAYPTLVFFDENLNMLSPVQGFMRPKQIEPVLKFLGEDHYKSQDYETFTASFKGTF